ncbi:OLC1v1020616C1 [Oldenlandia corymbosa var. corymbosa]|uniref:OLC1v1020616C1 n=1 Tax=Oldenlandia corymbosa var. corymbosa TaxID=529605 RepID=A0AAV1EGZ6_OLDCO|nr:OLC1v1020616C1 [Oldenlandia corymbosa var. corymbosa]
MSGSSAGDSVSPQFREPNIDDFKLWRDILDLVLKYNKERQLCWFTVATQELHDFVHHELAGKCTPEIVKKTIMELEARFKKGEFLQVRSEVEAAPAAMQYEVSELAHTVYGGHWIAYGNEHVARVLDDLKFRCLVLDHVLAYKNAGHPPDSSSPELHEFVRRALSPVDQYPPNLRDKVENVSVIIMALERMFKNNQMPGDLPFDLAVAYTEGEPAFDIVQGYAKEWEAFVLCDMIWGVGQQNRSCSLSSKSEGLEKVKKLVMRSGIPSRITSPHESLRLGNWVKLICGASFEDLADVRNLSLVYTLAGVDCIDCAAEAAVVTAVNEGIEAARAIVPAIHRPWVMVSVNDDEDPHFRKAEFDPNECPSDCSRPCEVVCPANAILKESTSGELQGGVQAERCYGCGRCIPICPFDKISVNTYIRDVNTTAELLKRPDVDAIEIHTNGRYAAAFQELWNGLGDSVDCLRLVAVSMPDMKESAIVTMNTLYSVMKSNLSCINLWQLDGRPMSGDIGRGATRAAIAFALSLASTTDRPQGYLQLAGGTNAHTVAGLRKEGLFQTAGISGSERMPSAPQSSSAPSALIGGIAFGGYARKVRGHFCLSCVCLRFLETPCISKVSFLGKN